MCLWHVGFLPEVIDDEDMCHESSRLQSGGLPKPTAVKLFVTLKDKHICPFSLFDEQVLAVPHCNCDLLSLLYFLV